MLVDPGKKVVRRDRMRKSKALEHTVDRRRWFEPPQELSDHSPIHYVTHLEKFLE